MKPYRMWLLVLLLIGSLLAQISPTPVYAQSSPPVVRAVLFYSPSCPHCHKVISEDLAPLIKKYPDQLNIVGVDLSQPGNELLYHAAIERFSIPESRLGVPTLIVNEVVLVGSIEIPEQFPGLVERYLDQGGVDWPDIPGLQEALILQPEEAEGAATQPASDPVPTGTPQASTAQTTPAPATATANSPSPTATPGLILTGEGSMDWRDKLALDPAGNSLAIFVLVGMLVSLVWVGAQFRIQTRTSFKDSWSWIIPVLCLIGFGVAGYLAYVETAQVEAVCGPVGDCNTVQQSQYARLFGLLPIGLLGLFGYIAIILAWSIGRYASGVLAGLATLALFAMTAFGTLFSIYLTFLEPFVIGATCAWCLASAVLMTLLMLLSVRPARSALAEIERSSSD